MATPYSSALVDKLSLVYGEAVLSLHFEPGELDELVAVLEKDFVGPYVYHIDWKLGKPVAMRPVFCDTFKKSGTDTWLALRDGHYVSAHSFHQFLDCRQDVHRERQLNELFEDE